MCNCIEQLSNKLKREKHAARVGFEHFGAYSSEVEYQPYRLDGQPYKHNRYMSVLWKFCPFCGVGIEKDGG